MKKIVVWVMLSLILQTSVLYILNNYVCVNSSEFKSKKSNINKYTSKDIKGSIPSDVKNVNLSYDGKYMTYLREKTLNIEDTRTGKSNEFKTENNEVVMCYTWLNNRNIIAIVEKVKKDGREKIQLITYDVKNDSKTFVQVICRYKENLEVENITTSVLTGVFYIHINKNRIQSMIYRIDRNNDLSEIDINAEVVDNMKAIQHEDRLVYENKLNNKIFATTPNKQLKFNSNNKLKLLDIDKNDVIYVGEINGDDITSVTYGKINEDISTWKKLNIDSPTNKDQLYCNNENQILINNNLEGYVKNLVNGKKVDYDGKFIQIIKDFIVSIDGDGKLIYIPYKDVL
ncbi:dipeptidyl-peptidase IV [Clostridium taeniosporum]|uniref:Dipeptidyl-peptidase IV n=1 Tax=Clostridium taeniosporum TaxID=394958 RepID=A0A1D7XNZ0_9CLOT|nr:dipeptidyl-peptidase IV [Clostridium taeniosporum]AOR25062.1 dipeptidyl-peptidase IV [Clostridium taeniosporum]